MDADTALLLGKLISSVETLTKRIDEVLNAHAGVEERVRKLESKAAWAQGVAWTALTLASAIGVIGGIAVKLI